MFSTKRAKILDFWKKRLQLHNILLRWWTLYYYFENKNVYRPWWFRFGKTSRDDLARYTHYGYNIMYMYTFCERREDERKSGAFPVGLYSRGRPFVDGRDEWRERAFEWKKKINNKTRTLRNDSTARTLSPRAAIKPTRLYVRGCILSPEVRAVRNLQHDTTPVSGNRISYT